MRRIPRKYVLIFLAFLTTLLCMVGSSTWIILSQKTSDPTKREKLDLTFSVESISEATPIFYDDTVSTANNTFELVNAVAKINNTETTVKGTFTVTELSINTADTGSSASFISQNSTATIQFTPTNTALYNIPDPITITSIPVRAMAYCGSTYFSTLNTAVTTANSTANSSSRKNVVVIPNLGRAINVTEELEIAQYVKLYIPYDVPYNSTNNTYSKTEADYSYDITEDELQTTYAAKTTLADSNSTNRVTLINLSSNITVHQNGGLYLGGQFGTIGVVGKYCEINLASNASITVSGSFVCYGYVKEKEIKNGQQNTYQNKYDNSYDSGRFIKICGTASNNASGSIESGIAIYDMKNSISELTNLNDNGVFPLTIFDFPNLQTYVEIEKGATFSAKTHVLAKASSISYPLKKDITLISSNTNSPSVFYLTDGTIGIEYCPTSATTNKTNKTRIYLNGEVSQGIVSMDLAAGQSITTEGKFLPFSYKFQIFINNGGTFTSDHQIKFLPGSLLQNNTGGEIYLNNGMIFYDTSDYSKIVSYPSGHSSARFINNGLLTLDDSESTKIGALIETTAQDDKAICNFSNCSDSSFSLSCKEGEYSDEVTRVSKGYFKNDNNENELYEFVKNSTLTSIPNENCWSGVPQRDLQRSRFRKWCAPDTGGTVLQCIPCYN